MGPNFDLCHLNVEHETARASSDSSSLARNGPIAQQ